MRGGRGNIYARYYIYRGRAMLLSLLLCLLAGAVSAKSAVELFEDGKVAQAKLDYYGAVECYEGALGINPNYGEAWYNMALCSYYLGRYDIATVYLDNAAKYYKVDNSVNNLRGFILIANGDIDGARGVFSDTLKVAPNDLDARFGLAELDLYDGKLSGAQKLYEDVLRRYSTSKRALLSLALLSNERKDYGTSEKYIETALRYHNDEAEVHYMASYLYCRRGDYPKAEAEVRQAILINDEWLEAYELLAGILFAGARYSDTDDVCNSILERNRNMSTVWYLKGLTLEKLGKVDDAVSAYNVGLEIDSEDEVMRYALELLAEDKLGLEDKRRDALSQYHTSKAREAMKRFDSARARYEYNRALVLNPYNAGARRDFNTLLRNDGNYEFYLEQLKFLNSQQKEGSMSPRDETTTKDTLEAIESMMTYSLARKWKIDPFYLDKTRWHYSVYYISGDVQLLHPEISRVTVGMVQELFSQVGEIGLTASLRPVRSTSEAFANARKEHSDFFIVVGVDENTREVTLDARLYNGNTGVECNSWTIFRTGNNRYSNTLIRLRNNLVQQLPTVGKILARNGNNLLIDLGKSGGVENDCVFDVVKAGYVKISDKDNKIAYKPSSILGQIKVVQTGEEVAEGVFTQQGFYDRQNLGDEVVLVSRPDKTPKDTSATTATTGENTGEGMEKKAKLSPTDDTGPEVPIVGRLPALIELIKNIR